MTICDFCQNSLFQRKWKNYEWRPHHTDVITWQQSVGKACDICTVLCEQVFNAFGSQSKNTRDQNQWNLFAGIPGLPLFEVALTKLAIKWQWLLQFRPCEDTGLNKGSCVPSRLRYQNFTVYLSKCRCDEKHI